MEFPRTRTLDRTRKQWTVKSGPGRPVPPSARSLSGTLVGSTEQRRASSAQHSRQFGLVRILVRKRARVACGCGIVLFTKSSNHRGAYHITGWCGGAADVVCAVLERAERWQDAQRQLDMFYLMDAILQVRGVCDVSRDVSRFSMEE